MKLTFYGAAGGNVIPSLFHLRGDDPDESFLIDCGDIVPEKKGAPHRPVFSPLDPSAVKKVLLTHGHTDHVAAAGYFVEDGFNGEVLSTKATKQITGALYRDNYKKRLVDDLFERYGSSREFLERFEIAEGVYATFYPAQGHILGASSVLIELEKLGLRILFSGDLGNTNKGMLEVKGKVPKADIVIMESTYGRREHHPDFAESLLQLYEGINDTYQKRGNFYIPVLSINRLQEALYYINLGKENGLIPKDMRVVVDSALGEVITEIYSKGEHRKYFSSDAKRFFDTFSIVHPFSYTTEIDKNGRNIILASSGLDGLRGRFRNHIGGLTSKNNSIAVVSHTMEGSLLDDIASGKETIGTNGGSIPLKAKSFNLSGFSSHADATQLIAWLEEVLEKKDGYVFLGHGEDDSRLKLKEMIVRAKICREENIFLPLLREEFDLTSLPSTRSSALITTPTPQETTLILFGQELKFSKPVS